MADTRLSRAAGFVRRHLRDVRPALIWAFRRNPAPIALGRQGVEWRFGLGFVGCVLLTALGVGQAILGVGDRSGALLFGIAIFGIAIGNLGFVLWRYTNRGRSGPEAPLGAGDGANNGGMRRALGAGVLLPLAVALLVVWAVVFGWVALGTWSIGPDEYADASEWWFDFAIPRAVGSLAVAIPAALVAALGARRLLGRSGQ